MHYYFAPMEGLTDHIYRKLHRQFFPGITKYYTPFLSPTVHRQLTPREKREIPPAADMGNSVVHQLLTKNSEDFLWMAQQCGDLGYNEVNLNLGCPSGTVTAKGKGSGMLQDLGALDCFLSAIFKHSPVDISVKCRIGFTSPEEFPEILQVFNQYPIKELTVHPRVRNAFYKGDVDYIAFRYAQDNINVPLCYNGNITSRQDIISIADAFPKISSVMLGRGLIGDPGMLTPEGTTADKLEQLYDCLLEEYITAFGSPRNAMFRLKEHWRYLICKFENSEKLYKRLRKTTDLSEYNDITKTILHTLPMQENLAADW